MIQCWDEVTLDEISEDITVGHVGPMANQYVDIGVPFLRSLNVEPFRINTKDLKYIPREFHRSLKKSALKPGDIVIVRTGKPGSCAVVPSWLHEANCSDVVVVRAGPKVRPGYICYVVNSTAAHHIDAHTVGAVQQHFNVGSARQIRLRLPPLAEQDRILSVLGTLDDKIELNRRMNETLEALARAIFKDWFVDFGPTRAKLEGRAPYLALQIWELFPVRLDSEGKPEGWRITVLEELLQDLETGGRPKGGVSAYTYGVPSVGAESIVGLGKFDYAKTKYIPRQFFDAMNKGHVKSRDVLLYKDGGRPGEYEPHLTLVGDGFPFDVFAINEHVYRLRAKAHFGQSLLYFWLSSDLAMEEMRIKGTGVAIPGLNSTQVKSLRALLPTPDVASAFDRLVEPAISRILANCNETRSLARIRDLLLPKLMSGEIRVKDAEKIVEAVARAQRLHGANLW